MHIKTHIEVALLIFLFSLIVSVNVSAEVIKTYNAVLDIECTDGFVFQEQGTYTDNGDGTFNYSATGLVHDHLGGFGTNIHSVACNGDINIEPFGQLFKITNLTTNTCTGLYGFGNIPYSYTLTDQVIVCDKTMESCQYYDNQYNDEVISSGANGYCRGNTSCTYRCSRTGTLLLVDQTAPPAICSDKTGPTQTCDNDDVGFVTVGNWNASTFSSGFEGSNYLHDQNSGKGSKTASWTFEAAANGIFEISAKWTSNSNRAQMVQYMYSIDSGALQACGTTVDQRTTGGVFAPLCTTVVLNAGQLVTIEVTNDDPSGYVIVDAVRISATPL